MGFSQIEIHRITSYLALKIVSLVANIIIDNFRVKIKLYTG
ncbi:hypothetical protein BATR1942_07535 [Bacillus atrophaeus 1942]|uniref:Uncharacterized protein n=1 Tax=Bacillus atrophaeus (strain 1942) TaxID=720555 RepID=A0ABM5LXP7_BACA1|nr:hypothetical protein BATR1942_07535 [Bacillus atrophaeus 1942]EIM11754.1 hypothetical protein UY9_05827 [Bacillus atrophaeus C89]